MEKSAKSYSYRTLVRGKYFCSDDESMKKEMDDWKLVEREDLIHYKGKTILVDDFSNLHGEEAIRIILLHGEAAIRRNKYDCLNLIDVTGSYADREILAALKKVGKDSAKFYSKVAVIGTFGVTKFFLHLVNTYSGMNARPFDSK